MKRKWPTVLLGEVLTERRETPPDEDILSGEIPIIAKIGFNDGKIELREDGKTRTKMILIRPGDLVISGINAAKGAIAVYGEENESPIAATIHYSAYIPNKDRVDIRYLWWFLRSKPFRNILEQHLPGGIKTELRAKRLLSIRVPLPPVTKQQQTVSFIEKITKKTREAQYLSEQTQIMCNGILYSYLDDILGRLKRRFHSTTLNSLVDPTRGISYGVVQTGRNYEEGIPTLRAGDIRWFRIVTDNLKKVHPSIEARYTRTRLKGGEVLLRIRGGLGEVAVCPAEMVGGNVSREIAVIPVIKGVSPHFVAYMIAAPTSQNFLRRHLRGTSYLGINLRDVRRLTIPLPPLDEQLAAVADIDALRAKIDNIMRLKEQTEAKLDALFSSILDKVFTGEL